MIPPAQVVATWLASLLVLAGHLAEHPAASAAAADAEQEQGPLPPTPPSKQDLAACVAPHNPRSLPCHPVRHWTDGAHACEPITGPGRCEERKGTFWCGSETCHAPCVRRTGRLGEEQEPSDFSQSEPPSRIICSYS